MAKRDYGFFPIEAVQPKPEKPKPQQTINKTTNTVLATRTGTIRVKHPVCRQCGVGYGHIHHCDFYNIDEFMCNECGYRWGLKNRNP